MPENEFEKKLSSEMQELKFRPSEQVWLRVEERIRKKKKRRVFIIIFLLAGIALLGYWQRNNLFGDPNNELVANEKPAEQNPKPSSTNNNSDSTVSNADNKTQNQRPKINRKVVPAKTSNNVHGIDKVSPEEKEQKIAPSTQANRSKNNTNLKKNVDTGNDVPKNKNQEPVITSNVVVRPRSQKQEITQPKPTEDLKPVNISPLKEADKQAAQKPADNKIDPPSTDTITQKIKMGGTKDTLSKKESAKDSAIVLQKSPAAKKWKWGIQFTPGISSLNDQNFSLGLAKSATADYLYSSPGTGSGVPPAPPAQPSDHKSGFAFHIGGFAKKQFTRRSGILIGLQYAYYSEHINVGVKSNTSPFVNLNSFSADANSYYNASNATENHTNRYHFLEASVYYTLQLNKNNTKPFTWDVGFNLGRLIATNAVMYDTLSRGIYYKNTDLLNKTQFSLSTGFSWTIVANQRTQWSLGPVIDIHLNSFLDNPFENKKYLFFAGLRSAVILNSEK